VLEGPHRTWSGTGRQHPEGPHLYEHQGTCYLLIAEGGTERGHAASIARGATPTGPWESCPANPILTHAGFDHPVQNIGHADLVEGPHGSWHLAFLGVRPKGITPSFHVLGRETFLAPVDWVDGWPVVRDVPCGTESSGGLERDDFTAPTLDPRWIAVRRPPLSQASLTASPGSLTLRGTAATLDSERPTFIGRRQQHHRCRVRALVEPVTATEAGLAVMIDETAHYEVAIAGDRVLARGRTGPFQALVGEITRPEGDVILEIETVPDLLGPDRVRLGVNGEIVAELDGRYLSTEVTGGFTGRVIGLYAVGGDAVFDWFEYESTPPDPGP
jgi:beta-xylosidase